MTQGEDEFWSGANERKPSEAKAVADGEWLAGAWHTRDHVNQQLDACGAPAGGSLEERLRAWQERERFLRYAALNVCDDACQSGASRTYLSVKSVLIGELRDRAGKR